MIWKQFWRIIWRTVQEIWAPSWTMFKKLGLPGSLLQRHPESEIVFTLGKTGLTGVSSVSKLVAESLVYPFYDLTFLLPGCKNMWQDPSSLSARWQVINTQSWTSDCLGQIVCSLFLLSVLLKTCSCPDKGSIAFHLQFSVRGTFLHCEERSASS